MSNLDCTSDVLVNGNIKVCDRTEIILLSILNDTLDEKAANITKT